MGIANKSSLYQSARDKRIRETLAASDIDEEAGAEHIRLACAEVRARWSAAEEKKRRRWSHGSRVECRVYSVEHRGYQISYVEK